MSPGSRYDVIVVGGGPAGAAAGAWLAQRGKRVLIVERETFPRFSVGESLLPHGNDLLRLIGVWEKVEAAGFMTKRGAEFCSGDKSRTLRFWFERNLGGEYAHSFQVERAKFDAILLDHAKESGCEVLCPAKAVALETSATGVRLSCALEDEKRVLEADWLLDCSGRSSFAGAQLRLRREETQSTKRLAVYNHFRGVFRNGGKAEGHITIVRGRDAWFWMIPLAGGVTSVGVVMPTPRVGGLGVKFDARAAFYAALEATPEARDRMAGAEEVCDFRATVDYSWRHTVFAQGRVILSGDAAGFVDPIFSSGVMLALKSSLRASELIVRVSDEQRGLDEVECAEYTREVACWMNQYSRIIGAFYDAAGFEVFMNPAAILSIPASIGRLVGGFPRPGLMDRLRLRIFFLICQLQRVIRLAPSIGWLREAPSGR